MKFIKLLCAVLACTPLLAAAAGGPAVPLDEAPVNHSDKGSLQRGAKMFVNYCLNCHAASYMRYSRLEDIGLTEPQIKENLLFASEKVGETMTVAMRYNDAKAWFGVLPPDLSVITRSRGADWLYTYLRAFYRDEKTPTGWNNLVFDKVGMPHVMASLQGEQIAHFKKDAASEGNGHAVFERFELVKPGTVTPAEYDAMVGDLVNYMDWMAEPVKQKRLNVGMLALAFLGIFFVVTYFLKKEFWKDIH
jgi:ubiquinol-cytochrome c reductase cytochrome c1 subunit